MKINTHLLNKVVAALRDKKPVAIQGLRGVHYSEFLTQLYGAHAFSFTNYISRGGVPNVSESIDVVLVINFDDEMVQWDPKWVENINRPVLLLEVPEHLTAGLTVFKADDLFRTQPDVVVKRVLNILSFPDTTIVSLHNVPREIVIDINTRLSPRAHIVSSLIRANVYVIRVEYGRFFRAIEEYRKYEKSNILPVLVIESDLAASEWVSLISGGYRTLLFNPTSTSIKNRAINIDYNEVGVGTAGIKAYPVKTKQRLGDVLKKNIEGEERAKAEALAKIEKAKEEITKKINDGQTTVVIELDPKSALLFAEEMGQWLTNEGLKATTGDVTKNNQYTIVPLD